MESALVQFSCTRTEATKRGMFQWTKFLHALGVATKISAKGNKDAKRSQLDRDEYFSEKNAPSSYFSKIQVAPQRGYKERS